MLPWVKLPYNLDLGSQISLILLLDVHLPLKETNPSLSSYLSRWKYKAVNKCQLSTSAETCLLDLYKDNRKLNAWVKEKGCSQMARFKKGQSSGRTCKGGHWCFDMCGRPQKVMALVSVAGTWSRYWPNQSTKSLL